MSEPNNVFPFSEVKAEGPLDISAIFEKAITVIYVEPEYSSDCMLKRNRCMVNQASTLLAVYNGSRRSGTGATVNYAQKLGREIIVIDPISRLVSTVGSKEN